MKKKIGFTSSFPIEIVFAAGHIPVDLNNIFIAGDAGKYIEKAEFSGYPRNICSWIKGMYGTVLENEIEAVVGVMEGDCSNTHSLMATFQDLDIEVIPFAFPFDKNKAALEKAIRDLEVYFGVSHSAAEAMKKRLDKIRKKLIILDKLTFQENKISGWENHLWLVSSSDFNGNPDEFEKKLDEFLVEAKQRKPLNFEFRLAFLGVPPIITDLYDFLLEHDANVVFNEIQRQFSMPSLAENLLQQYLEYTYPYSIYERLHDIKPQLKKRNIDAVISYTQSFCHRQIDNILLKKYIEFPFLSIEGDQPGKLDARTKLRIESFLDMFKY